MAAGSSLPAALVGAAVVVAGTTALLVALAVTGLTVLPVCDELATVVVASVLLAEPAGADEADEADVTGTVTGTIVVPDEL